MPGSVRTSVFVGTSLDGFIAREDGGLDWLPAVENADDHGYTAFIHSVDVIVVGRGTFDTVLGFDEWPYGTMPVVVLTSRPVSVPKGAAAYVATFAGSPSDAIAYLAGRGFTHAYVDGGITIQHFLEAGLIDRMIVTRVPVLIGQGRPLFGPLTRDVRLRHVATRAFPSGLVQSEYEVVR